LAFAPAHRPIGDGAELRLASAWRVFTKYALVLAEIDSENGVVQLQPSGVGGRRLPVSPKPRAAWILSAAGGHPIYPDFQRDGFYLENAVMRASLWPTFQIALADVRYGIQPGQLVKLDFTFADEGADKTGTETERMWATVKERYGDHWIGILDNDPRCHNAIACGREFHFHPDHVVMLWQDAAPGTSERVGE
jgi:hypothetical protein